MHGRHGGGLGCRGVDLRRGSGLDGPAVLPDDS